MIVSLSRTHKFRNQLPGLGMDLESEKKKGEMAGTEEWQPDQDGSLSWVIPTFLLTALATRDVSLSHYHAMHFLLLFHAFPFPLVIQPVLHVVIYKHYFLRYNLSIYIYIHTCTYRPIFQIYSLINFDIYTPAKPSPQSR